MNPVRIAISGTVLTALVIGALIYWLQIYAYYETIPPGEGEVTLVSLTSGQPEPVSFGNFSAIDSTSSPIRYRSCFEMSQSQATLTESFAPYPDATPLVAPGWFDCFDAAALDAALETGEALAFLSVRDVTWGVDRVVAVMPDGRGFAWNQISPCGQAVFNRDPAPDGCAPVPESLR